jgi:hypothetical protein
MAAKKLKEMMEESARATVQSIGQVATRVAQLDTSVFAEGFGKAADQAGIAGKILGETSRQLRQFDGALAELSKKFAQYSGPLAQAEAMAEVSQVLGDLNRAKKLEDAGLAELTNARSRASQAAQDTLVAILTPAIPVMIDLLEMIADASRLTTDGVKGFVEMFPTYIELIKASFSLDIREVARLQEKMIREAVEIKHKLEKREAAGDIDMLGNLLRADIPISVNPAPPRFPEPPRR